jgi:PAS domain S-box-containing protein
VQRFEKFVMRQFFNPSQSLLQAFANISPIGIFQADGEGRYIYVNQRWCEIAGLTPAAAHGAGWVAGLEAADRERVCAEWAAAVRGKSRFESKFRFKRPDGTITWVYGQAVKHGAVGRDSEGYVGTVTDLTRVAESEVEFRTAKDQYQLLFQLNPLPGWVFDVETHAFLEVNQMAVLHYGYSREEFLRMRLEDMRPAEEAVRLQQSLKDLPPGLKRAGVWIHRKKDGTLIDVELFNYGIQFQGRPARLVLANDVSDRKRYEESLKDTARFAALAETASIFAHEVANPLNGISTILQVLLRGEEVREPQSREMLQDALNEIGRLGGLLQEFRSFARPETISPEPLDIRDVIKEVLSTESIEYSEKGITVEQEFGPDALRINGDRQKLKQVLLNLFKNAVEAMPQGGVLKIRGHQEGSRVLLEVSDTGTGIKDGTNIFDPFTTTKPFGTGLGLPIVKKIVNAHRGFVSYQSQPDRGTVFTLSFPTEDEFLRN